MGDRAVFVCHENGEEHSPGISIHWGGGEALDLLLKAAPWMNRYDASKAAARLCGFLHERLSGSKGVALLPPPTPNPDGEVDWEQHGAGDAGVIVIDMLDAKAECFTGSLAGRVVRNLPFDQSDL